MTSGKSRELLVFEIWARTGFLVTFKDEGDEDEAKFNPNHDPDDGRFTFGPGGGTLPPRSSRAGQSPSQTGHEARKPQTLAQREDTQARLIQAQFRPNPRVRIGGNGGPELNDPLIIEHVFPTLSHAPGGAIVAAADNIFDLTGPAARVASPGRTELGPRPILRQSSPGRNPGPWPKHHARPVRSPRWGQRQKRESRP